MYIYTRRQNSLTHKQHYTYVSKKPTETNAHKPTNIYIKNRQITQVHRNIHSHTFKQIQSLMVPFFQTHILWYSMIHPPLPVLTISSLDNLWVMGLSMFQYPPCMGHHEFFFQTIDEELHLLRPYKMMSFRSQGNPSHFHRKLLPFSQKLSTVLMGL